MQQIRDTLKKIRNSKKNIYYKLDVDRMKQGSRDWRGGSTIHYNIHLSGINILSNDVI